MGALCLVSDESCYRQNNALMIRAVVIGCRQNTVSDYMVKIETRLQEEMSRAEQHLHASTKPKLLKVCTDARWP